MPQQSPGRRRNRRDVAAEATRDEVLRAARRLFAEQGYAVTTVGQIATEAGVAVQTVYSSVGSKAALVLALNDLIDAESGVPQAAASMATVSDPESLIRAGVHLTRLLNERCGDIVGVLLAAAPADADVAASVRDGMRRHQDGAAQLAGRLSELGALREGTSEEQAAASFGVLTSPAGWRQLTEGSGWSFGQAEDWLVESLTRLLLP